MPLTPDRINVLQKLNQLPADQLTPDRRRVLEQLNQLAATESRKAPAPEQIGEGRVYDPMQATAQHVQAEQERRMAAGLPPLSTGQQVAIQDIYKRDRGLPVADAAENFQRVRQAELGSRTESLIGRVQQAGAGLAGNLAETGLNVLGTVAPETAERLAERTRFAYETDPFAEGVLGSGIGAAEAGQFTGEIAKLAALAPAGAGGMGAFYFGQGVGGARRDVEQLREQGQDISGGQELWQAMSRGGVEGASGYIGGKIFGMLGNVAQKSPGLRQLVAGGGAKAATPEAVAGVQSAVKSTLQTLGLVGAEGVEEAATQAITNKLRQGIAPNQAVMEGVGEAGIMGALLAPFGGKAFAGQQRGQQPQTEQNIAAPARQPITDPSRLLPAGETEAPTTATPRAESVFVERGKGQMMRVSDEEAQGLTQRAPDPITEPSRLLAPPADMAEQRATGLRQQAQQQVERGTVLPAGQQPIPLEAPRAPVSEPQTDVERQMVGQPTSMQQQMLEQGLASEPATKIERQLVGLPRRPRQPQQQQEIEQPRTEQVQPGDPKFGEPSEQISDAVSDEADAIIRDLRQTGEVKPDVERRLRTLVDEARRNPLTGGMNRRAFEKVFSAVQHRARKSKKPVSIIALDAANLKSVNDKLGEPAGDQYLKDVQQTLESVLRESGAKRIGDAFHYGGDEYAVILPDTDEAGAKVVRDRLEQAFGKKTIVPGVSAFLVGETTTMQPGSRKVLSAVLEQATTGMKKRKARLKAEAGEAVSREAAEAAVAAGGVQPVAEGTQAPVQAPPQPAPQPAPQRQGPRLRQLMRQAQAQELRAQRQRTVEADRVARQRSQEQAQTTRALRAEDQGVRAQRKAEAKAQRQEQAGLVPKGLDPAAVAQANQARRQAAGLPPTPPAEGSTASAGQGKPHKRLVGQKAESWITPILSRLADAAPAVAQRLNRMEHSMAKTTENLKRRAAEPVKAMTSALGGKRSAEYRQFKQHVLNRDKDAAKAMLPKDQHAAFDEQYSILEQRLAAMRDAGVTVGDLGAEYWPRIVDDYAGLRKLLGQNVEAEFEDALDQARKTAGRQVLTDEEKTRVINSVVQGWGPIKPGQGRPGFTRARDLQVTEDTVDFYADPFESLFRYIDGSVRAEHRARFLGKHLDSPQAQADSIGDIIRQEIEAGNMDADAQNEVHDLLQARFTADLTHSGNTVRTIKNIAYMTLLGQFTGGLAQLTDTAISATRHGLGSSVASLAANLPGQKKAGEIAMEELGLHSHGQEFYDSGKLAKAVEFSLKATGFTAMDRLGKQTRINAAKRNLAKIGGKKGSVKYEEMARHYVPFMGRAEFEKGMADLAAGRQTDAAEYLLFTDITSIQPVNLSMMPQKYLEMPNGRIIYTFKTFMASQMNMVRRDMLRKIRSNNRRIQYEGFRDLARYALFFGGMGVGIDMLKDWLRGKDVTEDQLPDRVVDSALGLIGLNRYLVDRATADPVGAFLEWVSPPLGTVEDGITDARRAVGGELDETGVRLIRHMPIVGDAIYSHSPIGAGPVVAEKQRKRDRNAKLREIREEAAAAWGDDDTGVARALVNAYNDMKRDDYQAKLDEWRLEPAETRGDRPSRPSPLTFSNLRADLEKQK